MSDLISRADAIDACCRGWNNTVEDCIRNIKEIPSAWYKGMGCAQDIISALPSAEFPKGDLISRADAICEVLVNDGIDNIVDRINALPSAEADWIPCSERLPSEKDGQVLVTKRGEVKIATYSEFSGRWYLGDMCAVGSENPIAWMPLPKPYREDGEQE